MPPPTGCTPGSAAAAQCGIAPVGNLPLSFTYQTTNPSTNALTGTANTPVTIAAGGAQSFVVALSPSGAFGASNVDFSFACTNILSNTNVLNPFVHQYHPDHLLGDPLQCPTITRQITLQFTASDPNGLPVSGWGDNQVGGIYTETILGLYSIPLYVQGTFRLSLTCNVGVLNGGS